MTALALVNTFARWLRADDYPIGMPASTADKLVGVFEPAWGTGAILDLTAPSVAGDSRFREWFARYQRLSVAPGASTRIFRWLLELDVRSVLGNIQAPTLVVHRKDARHWVNPQLRPRRLTSRICPARDRGHPDAVSPPPVGGGKKRREGSLSGVSPRRGYYPEV